MNVVVRAFAFVRELDESAALLVLALVAVKLHRQHHYHHDALVSAVDEALRAAELGAGAIDRLEREPNPHAC